MTELPVWMPWAIGAINAAFVMMLIVLTAYLKNKGKEIATKQSVREITDRIEGVKVEYAKSLEKFKSDLWDTQQKQIWQREEYKIKLEAFKRATRLVSLLETAMGNAQSLTKYRELQTAAHKLVRGEPGSDEIYDQYLELKEATIVAMEKLNTIRSELEEVKALILIYFDLELYRLVCSIIVKSHEYNKLHWSPETFVERLTQEFKKTGDISTAKEAVAKEYSAVLDVFYPGEDIHNFFQKQRLEVSRMRGEI